MEYRKWVIATIVAFMVCVLALAGGYKLGIQKATTADGWLESDEFILCVDGQEYVWEVEK